MSLTTSDRLAYSPAEAAELIGISRAGLYQLMAAGSITSVKLGRRRLIRHEAIVDLLDRLEEVAGDAVA
jgi:excisionase family DNA binding protein